jgi:predicted glycosyltransferase
MTRPPLVFYCQHSLGLGHLARAWMMADALSSHFRVTVWCGGPLPAGFAPPPSCDIVALPPMAVNEDGRLVSLDSRYTVEAALHVRRELMLRRLEAERPAVVVVELFPFGRKKFEPELLPLLEAARSASPGPVVVCSLRDILVERGDRQVEHDERARVLAERYFDAVLVHADPAFARLDEFFHPLQPMRTPVAYTGFIAGGPPGRVRQVRNGILVSGGGGRFAGTLFMTAIEAHRRLRHATALTIVAGPLCDGSTWQRLVDASRGQPSVRLRPSVTDLSAAMAASRLSISQCGYNTALDIVRAGVPALVVPFAARGETEQTDRARRLEALGALRVLPADRLNAVTLAAAIEEALEFEPAGLALDLNGASRTTELLSALAEGANPAGDRRVATHEHLA